MLKTQIKNSQIVENFLVGNLRYESYNVETKIKKRILVENQNQNQPNSWKFNVENFWVGTWTVETKDKKRILDENKN